MMAAPPATTPAVSAIMTMRLYGSSTRKTTKAETAQASPTVALEAMARLRQRFVSLSAGAARWKVRTSRKRPAWTTSMPAIQVRMTGRSFSSCHSMAARRASARTVKRPARRAW